MEYEITIFGPKMMVKSGLEIEIVIKELRQLRMSADFFANTSHDISRYPGV